MRCLMFSLAALFLLACGDADNPMVPTAPAGKAAVDLSAEECAAADSLPAGFLELARQLNADLDEELLLATWKAHQCADWALWGLSWMASLNARVIFTVVGIPDLEQDPKPETAASHTEDSPPHISEGKGPREAGNTGDPTLQESTQDPPPDADLREADALPIVSVSSRKKTKTLPDGSTTTYAVFTFTRTGDTDERLTIGYSLLFGYGHPDKVTITSGFRVGETTFEKKVEKPGNWVRVGVSITDAWESGMTGNYIVGTRSASVLFNE